MDPIGLENNADETICNDMRHLRVSYNFDCKFLVGSDPNNKETIFGCKYVFAIESPVFEKMLLGEFQEAQNLLKGIPLPDDDPKALRLFRLLACCNDRKSRVEALNLDDTLNLTVFCQKYMALSITKLCTDHLLALSETATSGDLIKMFSVSRLFVDTPLEESIIDKLEVLEYPAEETLNDLNQTAFKDYFILLATYSSSSSVSLFSTVETYLDENDLIPKNLLDDEESSKQKTNEMEADEPEEAALQAEKMKRNFLRDLLKNIDFSNMKASEFVSGPGASNILTVEQKYHILSYICCNMSPIKLFEM